jgi:Ca2+-binding RTX toxin-like protein
VVSVPYGHFTQALVTNETTPLEPTMSEHKVYVKGIGFVQAIDQVTGEVEQLVKIKFDGTAHADVITGKLGTDELNGHAGNDRLNGAGGSDVVNGGSGNDWLYGGKDSLADLLHGGGGNDTLIVRAADRAFGDAGNDVFRLTDHNHFGTIDGGAESNADLAHARGDMLKFDGALDLTHGTAADRIAGIETLSMHNDHGKDTLTLNASDVLDLGDGHFDPAMCGKDDLGAGAAVRIAGDHGDHLNLAGKWSEVEAHNAPAGYDVFAAHTAQGDVFALVQECVSVHLG